VLRRLSRNCLCIHRSLGLIPRLRIGKRVLQKMDIRACAAVRDRRWLGGKRQRERRESASGWHRPVGQVSLFPWPAMSADGYLEPVGSSWRTSANSAVAISFMDAPSGSSKTRPRFSEDLTLHSMQPSQSFCSWAVAHNYLDVVAFHNCTRQRNVFRVANLKISHDDPSKSCMEVCLAIFSHFPLFPAYFHPVWPCFPLLYVHCVPF